MQWHLKPQWGGYQWDGTRYPNVTALLTSLHSRGLALGANLHDDDGVQRANNAIAWPAFAAALGLPPNATGAPFDIGSRRYADALAGAVMAPLTQGGLDLCWSDFEQGEDGVSSIPGVNPTAILNHFRFFNCTPPGGARGTHHSRYGGRGDHRHASHFGGDVRQSWASLAFLVDFTKTAANAPACWWGHEMMRSGGGAGDNTELFVRVNQFGAWSPTFTSWGNNGENNLWWQIAEPFASALRGALLDRQQLLPYRYTLAAEAARTGACPLRPMHLALPLEADAYATPGQYMLGAELLVAPALGPVAGPPIPPAGGGGAGGTVGVRVWLPPSAAWLDWSDPSGGPLVSGWQLYNASISTVPVFARAGAVVPLLPRAYAALPGASARQYDALTFRVFPGEASGGGQVYEDDGVSTAHLRGASATTALAYAPGEAGCTLYEVATRGSYAGMVASRA